MEASIHEHCELESYSISDSSTVVVVVVVVVTTVVPRNTNTCNTHQQTKLSNYVSKHGARYTKIVCKSNSQKIWEKSDLTQSCKRIQLSK